MIFLWKIMNLKTRKNFCSLIDLCFANFTLYCDVDQTDINDNFSVLGETDIFKVENIPLEKDFNEGLEKIWKQNSFKST